ncbi:MAG: bacterial Ig-like domain-containing protein [Ruminococcus sp.]|nr:bacterial Ig-like domain-containing protein [Ruminococcus sp.]MDD5890277.1 bacterial Ig-like domain-containing protein [Ruminococcus sp.]
MKTKRFFSIILAVLMLGSIFSGLTVSAAGTDYETATSGKVYFEKPSWAGTTFYCHIFETKSGTAFWGWQLKKEKLDETGNGKLVYDLSKLDESTQLKGGLKAGTQYSIMFSDNTGNETCALMFNTNCIGDTAYVSSWEKNFENQVDSTKHSYQISWRNNAKKYGIPLMITSVGTIQGKFIEKGTSPYDVIKAWDNDYKQYPNRASYSPQSSARDHQTRLAEIKKEFAKMISQGKILIVGGGTYIDSSTPPKPNSKVKLNGISVSGNYKRTYIVGQKFSKKGLKVTGYYSNGKAYNITNYKVKGFSSKKVGKKYIEVSYGGKKAYFAVTVKANKVSSLIISSLPKKTTYKVGQSINKKGLVIYARYNNGSMKKVTNYKLSYNFWYKGKRPVTVSYGGKSTFFLVTVK